MNATTKPIAPYEDEHFRDELATVDANGKRIWVYARQPKGKFTNARTYVGWFLIGLLFLWPFVTFDGEPIILLNIFERKFILLGSHFYPQDFIMVAVGALIFFVFISLFTVAFGRLWCGWACPQTLFMEIVFRRIEYLFEGDAPAQRKLNAAPWTTEKILRKGGKHLVFFGISLLIAHLVLAYLVGWRGAISLATHSPSHNLSGFIALSAFTLIFYGVFAKAREQVCVAICPYGRLQSVLLLKESLVVIYDFMRGEPRGRKPRDRDKYDAEHIKPQVSCNGNCGQKCNKAEGGVLVAEKVIEKVTEKKAISLEDLADAQAGASLINPILKPEAGDCIDCNICVQVCPTGIDIRNGTQLECINCTACIDACNTVMEKIGRPKGLIRIDSYEGVTNKRKFRFNNRLKAYSVVMLVLLGLESFLLLSRAPVQATLMRVPGTLFQKTANGNYTNLYNVQLVNKTDQNYTISFKLKNMNGEIRTAGGITTLKGDDHTDAILFIELKPEQIKGMTTNLQVEVSGNGKVLNTLKTSFIAPQSAE